MNEQKKPTGTTPSVFKNLLTEADVERLDTLLEDLPAEEFDASAVAGRTLASLGLSVQQTAGKTKPVRRSRLRMVLIAACVAVLLLGTFVAAKAIRDNRFVALLGAEETPEELDDAYIPLGYSGKANGYTFTVVDMLASRCSMIIEISTDYPIDAPDGWLRGDTCPIHVAINCTVDFPEEIKGSHLGASIGTAPFARDGKVWFMLAYFDKRSADTDISHLPVHLKVGALTFDWVNDYEAKDRTVAVNRDLGTFTLDEVELTVFEMVLRSHGKSIDYKYTLDSIKLKDGTTLYYTVPNLPFGMSTGGYVYGDDGKKEERYFNLMEGFSPTRGGDPVFVSITDIATVTVNGVEIPLE